MRNFLIVIALVSQISACSNDPGSDPTPQSTTGGTSDAATAQDVSNSQDTDNTTNADASSTLDAATTDMSTAADIGGGTDAGTETDMGTPTGGLYAGSGDPYATGALSVAEIEVAEGASGAPKDLLVFAPTEPGTYAMLAFQHGFSLRNSYYRQLLTHVASHGFVVVAPQMYEPSLFGNPSTPEEATAATAVWNWATANAATSAGVDVDATKLGLIGHSRGAKATWIALEGGYSGAAAVAGVDPVDGTGGPLGNEARVLAGGLTTSLPTLIIGAELSRNSTFGQSCAPQGDDHEAFYAAASAPAWWAFAEGYGHLDMLDDSTQGCGFTCSACDSGPSRAGMRTFTGGQLVAFFRYQLQGVAAAEPYLRGQPAPAITAQFMNK